MRVGQHVVVERAGELLNGTKVYSGRAVDDRAGCAVVVSSCSGCAAATLPVTLQVAFTVLEESACAAPVPAGPPCSRTARWPST